MTRLDEFLKDSGIQNFSAREVLTLRRLGVTVDPPPEDWWPRIVPALKVAEDIRAHLGHPLIIGNGFRPPAENKRAGGARRSQHLFFRAIDLDLPRKSKTREHQEEFYEIAAAIFLERGEDLKMGLGLYRPWRGSRVHIDCGFRRRHWSKRYTSPLLESLR